MFRNGVINVHKFRIYNTWFCPISEAIEQNDYHRLNELLVESRPCKPKEATAALQRAILKKSDELSDCTQLLLSKNADPNGTDGKGTAFVILTAESGCSTILKQLLRAGADPNKCRVSDNSTALSRAVWNNHIACVDVLLAAGAKTEIVDSQGRTPLIAAAQNDKTEALVSLLNHKGNLQVQDTKGRTVLYWATRMGNTAVTKLILDTESSIINSADIRGTTPLLIATERGFTKIVDALISAGADVDMCNDVGDTALIIAAKAGHKECLQLLVEAEADVDAVNKNGTNPLFHCMTDASSLSVLLEAGADPDMKVTSDERTVLAFLAARDVPECLQMLLEANAQFEDPVGKQDPKRPIQIAVEHGISLNSKLLFTYHICMGCDVRWLSTFVSGRSLNAQAQQHRSVREIIRWMKGQISAFLEVPKLSTLCRRCVRLAMGGEFYVQKVEYLPLPSALQRFMMMPELREVSSQSQVGPNH